jgi:hypothetical protein
LSNGGQSSFQTAGLDNLHLSSAFPKIRNNTKIYNTHLISQPLTSDNKAFELASYYESKIDQLNSLDYSIERVSNLLPAMSYLNTNPFNSGNSSLNNFLNLSTTPLNELNEADNLNGSTNLENFFNTKKDLLSDPTLSDGEDKILPTEQSVQQQKFKSPISLNVVSEADLVNTMGSSSPRQIADVTNN